MSAFSLNSLLYPKALILLICVAVILLWLLYYCYRLKQRKTTLSPYHAPYIAYSICIIMWISSNAYFHTGLLPAFGENAAILMAKVANHSAFFAFAFAYSFSCMLAAKQKNGRIYLWQRGIIILLTVYSLFINLQPNLTVKSIKITAPSQFIIEFGPHTPYFFLCLVAFIVLTLFNLIAMRPKSSKVTLAKTNYMIAGILVFMISTAIIQLGITFFLKDFSLTWLPPTLSISEMLFVGYALLTSRFYSSRYLVYITLNTIITCSTFILLLSMVFIVLPDDIQWLIAIPVCVLIGTFWRELYRYVGRYTSLLVYKNKQTPVQQILTLENDFKFSIDDAMCRLTSLLHLPDDRLRLVTSNYTETAYKNYISSKKSVLILDELSEEIHSTGALKGSIKALCDKMNTNNTALVMPLFGQCKSVTHLLISPHKLNNKLFSNEEISALQTLLTRIQNIVEADRRIRQSLALAHSIAHEMRNPLAQVQLQFETLKRHINHRVPPERIKSDIEAGLMATQRGCQLVDIILREVSNKSPQYESTTVTSIHKAIDQAINHFSFESEEIMARVHLAKQADFAVELNEILFQFVIFNLIRNAVYYFDSYPESEINITTQVGNYENILIFRDTGPGIDKNIIHKIFDDFFSYRKSSGSGLGLGYCQRVMHSFGGKIECYSEPGEFTEFHLYFPVVPNAPKIETLRSHDAIHHQSNCCDTEPKPGSVTQTNGQMPLILIVDDKEVQRTLTQMYLSQLGVNCIQASHGKHAVALCQSHNIDLVLMDIRMPVMNGFDASRQIKQLFPQVPIIALSGESGENELQMINRFMDGRLEKPTTLNALKKMLEQWLNKEKEEEKEKESNY